MGCEEVFKLSTVGIHFAPQWWQGESGTVVCAILGTGISKELPVQKFTDLLVRSIAFLIRI